MTQTVYMFKGLPASGKSKTAKEMIKGSNGSIKRINKDLLREMIDDKVWSKGREKNILAVRDLLLNQFLEDGYSVIIDDTNLALKHETHLRQLVDIHNKKHSTKVLFEVVDHFLDVSVEECIKRDIGRLNAVGAEVIMNMYNQYLSEVKEEDKYIPNDSLPDAFIFDIDGTLAEMHNRGPFEWAKVGNDKCRTAVADTLYALKVVNFEIIIMSGRDSVCRPETEAWLEKNNIEYDLLLMRAEGDGRPDTIVKKEMFDNHIRKNYNVYGVFDDRPNMIRLWKGIGLTTFNVDRRVYPVEF